MKRDLLDEAVSALRDSETASEAEAKQTRADILNGLRRTRVQRRTRIAYLLPIAATFMVASAWGAASGQARALWSSVEHVFSSSAPSAAPPVKKSSPLANATPPAEPTPTPTPPLGAEAARVSNAPEAAPPRVSNEAPLAVHPLPVTAALPSAAISAAKGLTSAQSSATPSDDPALALYRAAHTAHFVDHDPARALAGWDAYLKAAPNGVFAPEARYNRALSLIRLGRIAEAKRALEPFAQGQSGGYRQQEAQDLLSRLPTQQ